MSDAVKNNNDAGLVKISRNINWQILTMQVYIFYMSYRRSVLFKVPCSLLKNYSYRAYGIYYAHKLCVV